MLLPYAQPLVGDRSMTKAFIRLGRSLAANRNGGTAIEYGLIAALIVVAMIASLKGLANTTSDMWNNVETEMRGAH